MTGVKSLLLIYVSFHIVQSQCHGFSVERLAWVQT